VLKVQEPRPAAWLNLHYQTTVSANTELDLTSAAKRAFVPNNASDVHKVMGVEQDEAFHKTEARSNSRAADARQCQDHAVLESQDGRYAHRL